MPAPFRIATFNVENLFSRAKVLNLRDNEAIGDRLEKISQLQKLLEKPTYSAADKTKMLELYGELKLYIEIQADRGKFFNPAETKITASGASDWDGSIVFRRAKFSEQARLSTARVIKALKADVQCIIEAEDRKSLEQFDSDLLGNLFKYSMLIDGNDPRGIDVGVLSKIPFGTLRTHLFDRVGNSRVFSRDCLEIECKVPNGPTLHVLVNHLKSKGYGAQAENDARRKQQAIRVAEILAGYDLKNDYVIVAGDMNDTPDSAPLAPLVGVPDLYDVLALQFGGSLADRWTYWFSGAGQQIDFLLVSKPLKDRFVKAGVERRGIFKIEQKTGGAVTAFPEVTSATSAASDHGAVWADFNL